MIRTSLIALIAFALGAILVWTVSTPKVVAPTREELSSSDATPSDQVVTEEGIRKTTPPSDTPKRDGVVLSLSGRGLTSVPKEVFTETGITTLDLSHNNLTGALPAEVRHLSNLEVLDLSNNNMTGVPAEVGQLSQLRVLDLSNNPITGLPYEIGNLSKLERLDLSGTNYSRQDLQKIMETLPSDVVVVTD